MIAPRPRRRIPWRPHREAR